MTSLRPRVLLIQAGTASADMRQSHGDLSEWFGRAIDLPAEDIEVVRVFEGAVLPPPDASRIAIITGSWAMVTERLAWSEATAEWIREAVAIGVPLFGVCYGHQLIAHALGGRVDYHPNGHETGCQTVRLTPAGAGDPLFTGTPVEFVAHLTHTQSVIDPPPGAKVLASSDHEPHQMLRYAPNVVSAQFHPEFTPAIMRAVIQSEEDLLRRQGQNPSVFLDAVADAPEPLHLLRRFMTANL